MPPRIAALPVDPQRGVPVPWFVAWIDGAPDFRVVGKGKLVEAFKKKLCWICGGTLGQYKCFVIGPMCGISRTTPETPSHLDCAQYTVRACPFLSRPRMRRNEEGLPEERTVAGIPILRNPGVTLLWITKSFKPFDDGRGGVLFQVGDPVEVQFYREGRVATRAEIMESVDSGFPLLMNEAIKEGAESIDDLKRCYDHMLSLLPRETARELEHH